MAFLCLSFGKSIEPVHSCTFVAAHYLADQASTPSMGPEHPNVTRPHAELYISQSCQDQPKDLHQIRPQSLNCCCCCECDYFVCGCVSEALIGQ